MPPRHSSSACWAKSGKKTEDLPYGGYHRVEVGVSLNKEQARAVRDQINAFLDFDMIRISFSAASKRAIIRRATDMKGRMWCEQCGAECLTRADYEIDHFVAEGIQPANDNRGPLTAADGKLLCLKCHDKKTRRDVFEIAKAKRLGKKHRVVGQGPDRDRPPVRRQAGARLMRLAFLVLAVLAASPADAKCHLFSVWHYPWPQRCGVARQMVRLQVLHLSAQVRSQIRPQRTSRPIRTTRNPPSQPRQGRSRRRRGG